MTNITSEDIFLGRKQEDFDLAEKLLVKHGKLSTKCVREMADAVYGRMGIVECHKILQRVWNDMHVKKIEDENAKLRELARRYSEYTGQDRCEGCVYKSRCNDGYVDECWQLTEIRSLARELGIEVTE